MEQHSVKAGLSRRAFDRMLAGLVLAAETPFAQAFAPENCPAARDWDWIYVGSEKSGVHALRFDVRAGRLTATGQRTDVPAPRWLTPHPQRPLLYVASDGGPQAGKVIAYAHDSGSGALQPIGAAEADGGPTHLWLDFASATLLAAHFGSGSVITLPLQADGAPGARRSAVQDQGSGPHRRQAGPHAHGVLVDPSGRYALVADMGADRVFAYRFDRATQSLVLDEETAARTFATAAGSGPRHLAFGAGGRVLYVLTELSAEILVLQWNAGEGHLALLQTVPLASPGSQGAPSASEIAVSADGRFVYAANRSENTLLAYQADPATGRLQALQQISCGGETPWAFGIHPTGRWMLVANYRSRRLNLFGIDTATGRLSDTGQSAELPSPISVAFITHNP